MELLRPALCFPTFTLACFHFSLFFLSLKCPKMMCYGLTHPLGRVGRVGGRKGVRWQPKVPANPLNRLTFFLFLAGSGRPELTLPVDRKTKFPVLEKGPADKPFAPPLHLICFYPFYPNFKN